MCFNIRSPEPQTHLGLPGKAFLITIVFAKIKKSKQKKKKQNKNKQTKKIQKKEERKESHPGFYFKPPRGEVAPCAWASLGSHQADLWAHRALFLSSALQCGMVLVGYGSGRVAKAVGTRQGV